MDCQPWRNKLRVPKEFCTLLYFIVFVLLNVYSLKVTTNVINPYKNVLCF